MLMLYDSDNYPTSEKKKPNILGKIAKWSVYLLIAFIYGVFMIKIFTSCDPSESKILLFDDDAITVYHSIGEENFVLYDIKSRDNFGDGDTFFIDNVVYLESSEQLQFTMRYKKNRLDSYREVYYSQVDEYKRYSGNLLEVFDLTLQVSNMSSDLEPSFHQEYYTYQFETDNYYYHRVNFNNIKIDYRESKVELFVTLSGIESVAHRIMLVEAFTTSGTNSINIEKITEGDYFARFTIFDINTAKEKINMNKYEIKAINMYSN